MDSTDYCTCGRRGEALKTCPRCTVMRELDEVHTRLAKLKHFVNLVPAAHKEYDELFEKAQELSEKFRIIDHAFSLVEN